METETVSRTRVYFLSNVCHVCKKKNPGVRCEICQMIFYCSPEHRRENWYHHSQLCRAIHKIKRKWNLKHLYEKAVGNDSDGFRNLRHEIALQCTKIVGRALLPWELELLYHPRLCNVCHEFDLDKLKPCKGCKYIYTCEKNHFKQDHGKWCSNLKLYCEVMVRSGEEDIKAMVKDLNAFPGSMCALDIDNGKNHSEAEKAIFSELLTYPLTVLHALKEIQLHDKETITLHLIGAELEAEVEPIEKWEKYLLHALINVKLINLLFIGPELRLHGNGNHKRHLDLCANCREMKRHVKFEFIPGKFYHDFIKSENFSPADLVCAFNSGMYRQNGFSNHDSWKETIKELFLPGRPPVVVTEYTSHELKEDVKIIRKQCSKINFHVEPSLNPFASLKPGLNIISEDDSPVIFKNYYHMILSNENSQR